VSGERALETSAPLPQQANGDEHGAGRACQFHVGDPIPYVLTKDQLAIATGYSTRQIDRFRLAHSHPGIKQLDGPGNPRFCGRTLRRWLDDQIDAPPKRHYFGADARRRA
jgi:hypothetical protein